MPPRRRRSNTPPADNNGQAELIATITAIITGLLPSIFTATNGGNQNHNGDQSGNANTNTNQSGGIGTWLNRFQKQNPKSFSRAETPADSKDWIAHIEKIFSVLGVEAQYKSRLAAYKLEGSAFNWWQSVREERGGDEFVEGLSWTEFREIFFEKYFSNVDSGAMKREYHNICQSEDESLSNFTGRFYQYVGFLGASAGTQEEIAEKYQWAVCDHIRRSIIQNKFYTLNEAVDAAKRVDLERQDFMKKVEGKKRSRDGDRIPTTGQSSQGTRQGKRGQGGQNEPWKIRNPNPDENQPQNQNRTQPENIVTVQKPLCNHCNKRHDGVCWKLSGACFRCGEIGHMYRDCPKNNGRQKGE